MAIRHRKGVPPLPNRGDEWGLYANGKRLLHLAFFHYNRSIGWPHIHRNRDESDLMNSKWNRREVLKGLLAASTTVMIPQREAAQGAAPGPAGQIEIQVTPISACTFRL